MPKAPIDKDNIDAGFSLLWLARAFHTTRHRVSTALAGLTPKGKGGKANLYDLHDAAKLLVVGEVDWQEFAKRVDKKDLPPALQSEVWAAMRAEKKFRQEAGELWVTDAVFELLSECFGEIRSELRIYTEAVERESGLSREQRRLLTTLTDETLNNLRQRMLRLAAKNTTRPALDELTERVR